MRRGNEYTAAHYLRMIVANDERPRTMHAEAERTQRDQLPPVVADLLERNQQRRTHRRETWRQHVASERRREAAYQRLTQARGTEQSHQRSRSADGYGLEL